MYVARVLSSFGRSQVVGGVARGVGDNRTYICTYVGIDCRSLLNELSDCLLTNCCVHLFHDLMVLGKKECFRLRCG